MTLVDQVIALDAEWRQGADCYNLGQAQAARAFGADAHDTHRFVL